MEASRARCPVCAWPLTRHCTDKGCDCVVCQQCDTFGTIDITPGGSLVWVRVAYRRKRVA